MTSSQLRRKGLPPNPCKNIIVPCVEPRVKGQLLISILLIKERRTPLVFPAWQYFAPSPLSTYYPSRLHHSVRITLRASSAYYSLVRIRVISFSPLSITYLSHLRCLLLPSTYSCIFCLTTKYYLPFAPKVPSPSLKVPFVCSLLDHSIVPLLCVFSSLSLSNR